MRHLDLVITCESAVRHMAALAGKECWVPYSRLGKDFRIGVDGTKAIWTPKHRAISCRPRRPGRRRSATSNRTLDVKVGTHSLKGMKVLTHA
jgi:hypothetical protein